MCGKAFAAILFAVALIVVLAAIIELYNCSKSTQRDGFAASPEAEKLQAAALDWFSKPENPDSYTAFVSHIRSFYPDCDAAHYHKLKKMYNQKQNFSTDEVQSIL